MMGTKTIETGVLLSLATGRLLCDFPKMHEAADFVLGEPLMTHNFASQHVADRLAKQAHEQHPWTADEETVFAAYPNLDACQTREDAKEVLQNWLEQHIYPAHGRYVEIEPEPEHVHIPLTEGLPAKFGGTP